MPKIKNVLDELDSFERKTPRKKRNLEGEVIIETPIDSSLEKKISTILDRNPISRETLPDYYIDNR